MSENKYVKISDGLYLLVQGVERPVSKVTLTEVEVENDGPINHEWIFDRSGSMYDALPSLCDDLIEKVKQLPEGDAISIGWFSGRGQYRFVRKGAILGPVDKRKDIIDTINGLRHTVGSTMFSEILEDLIDVVAEVNPISSTHSIMFLTDGWPTEGNYQTEVNRVLAAITKIAGKVSSAMIVGYGNGYNKELLTQIASKFGGTLIHSSSIHEFKTNFQTFVVESKEFAGKTKVVPEKGFDMDLGGVFTYAGRNIQMLSVDEKSDEVEVPMPRRGVAAIYGLSTKKPGKTFKEYKLDPDTETDIMTRAAYAAAYVLTQQMKADMALEIMGALGDKKIVDAISNAFVPDDYGKVESALRRACERKDARFVDGRKIGCVPDKNAFCVMDVIEMLQDDGEAMFYPYHPDFIYKRIGVPQKTVDGYPKFEAEKDAGCAINQLTWNGTMLNLSILARIPGTVKLTGDYKKHGFAEVFPTFAWRNYTVIRDGSINASILPVSMGEESFKVLKANGLVSGQWGEGHVYAMDLSGLPVINRAMVDSVSSAKPICDLLVEELKLEAKQKLLNYNLAELNPDQKTSDTLTEAQQAYLETQGVTKSGFSPPKIKEASTDHYMAKEFDIKIAKFSSLPKIDVVLKKLAELATGKGKLTDSEKFMAGVITENLKTVGKKTGKKLIDTLELTLTEVKSRLREVRSEVQRTKMAVILAKKWFTEFTSRDSAEIQHGGYSFTFSLKEKKIDL